MAGRPQNKRVLDIWMNGEFVGKWRVTSNGHTFAYDDSWYGNHFSRPISLSMPLVPGLIYSGEIVEDFFDNLLPDNQDIRKRVASRLSARSNSAFDLIEKAGRDCVGAITVLPAGSAMPDVCKIEGVPLSNAEIEAYIDGALHSPALGIHNEDDFPQLSIAGAQEKTALLFHEGKWMKPVGTTPTTHILKLPLGLIGNGGVDFSTSVENEWLCSWIARGYGLKTAKCDIKRFGKYKVLAVERFDRRLDEDMYLRLPQEDYCQVLGYPSSQKYQNAGGPGIDDILEHLRGSTDAVNNRRDFLKTQLLFWLLAAPDGHAKNFSVFLEPQGAFRLTPLYDIISAWPGIGAAPNKWQLKKVKLAMGLKSKNMHYLIDRIKRRHWNAVAQRNRLGKDFETVIEEMIEITPDVIDELRESLPIDFPVDVSEAIFDGMSKQVEALKNG
jgi:serine/threonine-protein kinase HipA